MCERISGNASQSNGAFPVEEAARFAALYPRRPGKLAHGLSGHPLLTIEALADASERMKPANVKCAGADNRQGAQYVFADPAGVPIGEAVRTIAQSRRYVLLSFLEQLPEYDALMRETIARIEPAIRAGTGAPRRLRAFLFISAPGTLSPFHFDAEYNILLQIAGRKVFSLYRPVEPWLTGAANERYHLSGDNVLAWEESFADQGEMNSLGPGEALYVPCRWPHWVEVGEEPSISLSFTWCSRASNEQDDAYRLNAWLRRFGIEPPPPRPLPARAPVRSFAYRALNRLHMA
jgi:hypothetical protein